MEDFLPEIIVRDLVSQWNSKLAAPALPRFTYTQTVALFADVSGFTALSERLAAKGAIGAEHLGYWLNRYFELMVKIIYRHGGDVFKFAGDAVVAVWPLPKTGGRTLKRSPQLVHGVDLSPLLLRAVHCALAFKPSCTMHCCRR